jgi:hypothetical protein
MHFKGVTEDAMFNFLSTGLSQMKKETLIYCEINYGTRIFDGVIGDVFLSLYLQG